jgi:Skp family chaperone for outer membrane proteins
MHKTSDHTMSKASHRPSNTSYLMKTLFLSLTIVSCFITQAQNPETTANTIDVQFKNLIEESNDFQEYKVIEQAQINQLRKNTNEHIQKLNKNISSLEASITTKDNKIGSLEKELAEANKELSKVKAERNSMNFLGIQTNKGVYNTIVWAIVGVLGFLFVLMSMRFKSSNATTKAAKNELKLVEDELEDLRHKSIEKVQKLGRELQDERNKLSKLKGEK